MTESIELDIEEGEGEGEEGTSGCVLESESSLSRKVKRKAAKKEKRKQLRKELAEKARAEEEARLNDPEEQRRIQLEEERENERLERERREFEERERLFLEALARKKAEEEEEEERRKALEEESKQNQAGQENASNEDDDWEYVEEGPPEIIWQGNEIIVKKNRVRVKKNDAEKQTEKEDPDRPTSNPLLPQSEAFSDYKNASMGSAQQLLENVAQQIPNFGTEQDKSHCPFHLKTGACRFGSRCSRVHFYPDKSCTLLLKNMYNGPGLAWEQDEGLEYTDEEVERCYEEFYEDVHTEFLKFGEIINFKVCRNGSFHLRGNLYVHYKSLDSAVLAYHSINGRYFAGKQVKVEFVGVTRWKVAICGEYMKSRFKTCSHGTACNFIHCFRNPGGDYEWADWDKPAPNYWVKNMAALFGYSDESGYDKQIEQENLGQLRNSSKMSADADRYYSRRSQSRERDYLNGSSSCSRYEDYDVRKTTFRQRNTSDGRKRLRTIDEKNHEERKNSKNTRHGRNRTCDTDSDGDWSDRDRDGVRHHYSTRKSSRHQIKVTDFGGSRSRTHETGSDGDFSNSNRDRDRDRDRHHDHARKNSRNRKEVSEIPDNCGNSNNGTRGADSRGDLDEDRDGRRHHSDRRNSSRHRNKMSTSPDGHWDSRSRTHDSGSGGDWSDGDRDRHHSHRREGSRHSNEVLGLSDHHGELKNSLNNGFYQRGSDQAKLEQQRIQKSSHSRRMDRLSKETCEASFLDKPLNSCGNHETTNSSRYRQRIKSSDLDSSNDCDEDVGKVGHWESEHSFREKHKRSKRQFTSDLDSSNDCDEDIGKVGHWESEHSFREKHKRSKRQFTSDQNAESSQGRYDVRNIPHDSGHHLEENIDERDRWEPDKSIPEKHHKSRRKFGRDDHKEYSVKSKSRDQNSDEGCGESRSRRSSCSSHGKHSGSLDEMDSAEELQESEVNHKQVSRKKCRGRDHKRQDKKTVLN